MFEKTPGDQAPELFQPQLPDDVLDQIESPGLVFFVEAIRGNIDATISQAGDPAQLRPHFKTHKTREIARMWLERGVCRHKCATLAEAETLASTGATDILVAYQLVGPNIARLLRLTDRFPAVRFASLVDCPEAVEPLAAAFDRAGKAAAVFLDLNTGMNRSGAPLNRDTIELYELLATTPGVKAAGLHWYDGHHRQTDRTERSESVLAGWEQFIRFRDQLVMTGLEVPCVVAGGSGSFDCLAGTGEPGLQVSPGTVSLWDASYHRDYNTLPQQPAAVVLTRVVSRPGPDLLTLDAGHKSLAGDLPLADRARFPAIPDARLVGHSEEHLVIETRGAHQFAIGTPLVAIPGHICPTVALHDFATVIENGQAIGEWPISARHRRLRIAAETSHPSGR